MVEAGGGVSFPVVLHDGERDSDIGSVVVSSSMEFKNFQSILSKMIGISSHQFTVYLAECKISMNSTKIRRRIPITGKVNFGAISGEKSCFFLVVLKRLRCERRRKVQENENGYCFLSKKKNVMLLRRNAGVENELLSGYTSPAIGGFEYETRFRKLQLEEAKYLIGVGLSNLTVAGDGDGGRRSETAVCRYCLKAKETGVVAGFHCCANDTVTTGFRSRAGPIARPVKNPTKDPARIGSFLSSCFV